jgi:hypothetical protein
VKQVTVSHERRESTVRSDVVTVTIGETRIEFRIVAYDGSEPRLTIDMPADVSREVLDEAIRRSERVRAAFRVAPPEPGPVSRAFIERLLK